MGSACTRNDLLGATWIQSAEVKPVNAEMKPFNVTPSAGNGTNLNVNGPSVAAGGSAPGGLAGLKLPGVTSPKFGMHPNINSSGDPKGQLPSANVQLDTSTTGLNLASPRVNIQGLNLGGSVSGGTNAGANVGLPNAGVNVAPPRFDIDKPAPKAADTKTKEERAVAWRSIRDRLPRLKVPEVKEKRKKLFAAFDRSGNKHITYPEAVDGSYKILHLDDFTDNLEPILSKAYKAALKRSPKPDQRTVEFLEFRVFLCYIYDYFELWIMFDELDHSGDQQISLSEFKAAIPRIKQWGLTITDPETVFKQIDTAGGGSIDFTEFCDWAANQNLDADGEDNIQ